jgi:hypothetical protein
VNWLDLFMAYITAIDVVVTTASRWGPLLLAVVLLVLVLRCPTGTRHRPCGHRRDVSGHGPDSPPDTAEGEAQ